MPVQLPDKVQGQCFFGILDKLPKTKLETEKEQSIYPRSIHADSFTDNKAKSKEVKESKSVEKQD